MSDPFKADHRTIFDNEHDDGDISDLFWDPSTSVEREISELDDHTKQLFLALPLQRQSALLNLRSQLLELYQARKALDFLDSFDRALGRRDYDIGTLIRSPTSPKATMNKNGVIIPSSKSSLQQASLGL